MPLKLSGSKLFLLLSALSREEMKDFRHFLAMPLLNNSEALLALQDYCMTLHPDFPEEQSGKEWVHAALFPKEEFKEKRIRDLFSDLSLQATHYLSWRAFYQDEGMKKLSLIREYEHRRLMEYALKEGARRLAQLKESPGRSAGQQLQKFLIKDLLFEENESLEEYLKEAHQNLDQFFMLSKLRLSAMLFSRRRYLSGTQDIYFLEEIRRLDGMNALPELERLYLRVLELLTGEIDKEAYQAAKQIFFQLVPEMAFEDKRVLFQSLINFTLRVINETDPGYISESWDLYMQGLETRVVFSEKNELSDTTFTNIVINGAATKQFQKTERFILDNQRHLPEGIRNNAVALGKAYLSYNQEDYDKVIELLQDVKYSAVSYAVRGRSLLLRTYFDQASGDKWTFSPQFFSLLEAFQKYVKRNDELAEGKRQGYLNFLSFTKDLAQAAGKDRTNKKISRIREEILQTQQVIAKDWLLQRAELIGKR